MSAQDLPSARRELLELLRTFAFERREVTLASGKKSSFYVDCKQVTLQAAGHVLIGKLLYQEIKAFERRSGLTVKGVGGLTLGADPIASAVSTSSGGGTPSVATSGSSSRTRARTGPRR